MIVTPRQDACRNNSRAAAAFTLVELLVVIAILGLLTALALPALASARARGRATACLSNVRQIALSALQYGEESGRFPAAYAGSEARWMDTLKPYVEKNSALYLCPSDAKKIAVNWDPSIHLSYGINTFRFGGEETCFWYPVKVTRVARPGGTILFGDCTPESITAAAASSSAIPFPTSTTGIPADNSSRRSVTAAPSRGGKVPRATGTHRNRRKNET